MKKLFALALTLCLLCGCTALAENEITWEQVAPIVEAGNMTGDFVAIDEVAAKIWIPAGFVEADAGQEGVVKYFAPEDGSESYIAVVYVDANGMELAEYAEKIAANGATEVETGTVNGIPCVSYELADSQTMGLTFATQAGYLLDVVIAPVSSDEEKMAAGVILASIQAAE